MNLVGHLIRHDVRSQRAILTLLALLLALEVMWILAGYTLPPDRAVGASISLGRMLLASLLTARLIHRDPLVGTTAFWRTRPIGSGTLLASKLASLGLVAVLLPAVVLGAAWWGTGLLPTDGLVAVRVLAVEQAMVVVITAMAAVVTASLVHLVIAGVAGVALVTLANGVLLPAIMATRPFVWERLFGVKPAWYLGTLFAFGLAAVAHQYFTLREWRTAGLVAFALVAAVASPRFLARDAGPVAVPLNRAVVSPDAVSLSAAPGSLPAPAPAVSGSPTSGRTVEYFAALVADGLADGVFVRPLRIDGRLTADGGSVSFSTRPGFVLIGAPGADAWQLSLQAALGEVPLLAAPQTSAPAEPHRMGLAQIRHDDARRLVASRQTLMADVELAAGRCRVAATAPLRPGSRLLVRGKSMEILSVTPGAGGVAELHITSIQGPPDVRFFQTALCLRNRDRRQAARVYYVSYRRGFTGALGMLGVRPEHATMTLKLPSDGRPLTAEWLATGPGLEADWLAGAELVYLDVEDLGTFTRPLRMEFTIPGDVKQP
ncbi:MAG: hypothetical protein AB1806_03780 [Acidobacteriota bacterium]